MIYQIELHTLRGPHFPTHNTQIPKYHMAQCLIVIDRYEMICKFFLCSFVMICKFFLRSFVICVVAPARASITDAKRKHLKSISYTQIR